MKIIETVLLPVKFKCLENQVFYMKGGVIKGGLRIEIFKKLILVNIAVVDIFRPVLTSYGTLRNGKGVYKLLEIPAFPRNGIWKTAIVF